MATHHIKAVLFDFGGTLYDYRTLAPGDLESLVSLARWSGIEAEPADVGRAYLDSMRRVFRDYLPKPFYLHGDLFRDAVRAMLESFGAVPDSDHLARYRAMQWELHQRDLVLRNGVIETLTELRARRLHVGIVSNIDEDQLRHLIDLTGLDRHFDSLLSSEHAQSCKPDPAIFTEAIRRAACRPSEALFVGDTIAADVAGANRSGLFSVLLWHRDDREPPDGDMKPHHVIREIPEVLDLLTDDWGAKR
jgi:putative hydrolase of the HAD superfamily